MKIVQDLRHAASARAHAGLHAPAGHATNVSMPPHVARVPVASPDDNPLLGVGVNMITCRPFRIPVTSVACLAFAASTLCAHLSLAQADVARMDEIVQSYVNAKTFMGSVLVAQGQRILLDHGYGYANLEWQVPNTPDTKFRLGSITKQFTAASILLLKEQGKLRLDAPVKTYMADAPAAWDHVTIYNLLTHTSGIPSFTDFPDFPASEATPTTPEQLVARFRDKPLDFQPGQSWKYDNSGYVLLGYLIQKISGTPYPEFLETHLFKPLGMNESDYDSSATVILHHASGYSPGPNGPVHAGYTDMTVPYAAGALYSTTHDLWRWEQSLFGGKVVSAESLKEMTTPFKNDYAFGLYVRTVNGRTVISHAGGIEGFNTQLAYYPADSLTVVVLANLNGSAPGAIERYLAAVVHGEKVVLPSERKVVTVSPKVLAGYVGTYRLSPTFNIVITLEGDQLMSQSANQSKMPLFAESSTKFFPKVVDAELEFVTDATGKATSIILHQGAADATGVRQ
jgi:CubicO group peptidase (beta-lactamase class C family)